MSTKQINVPLLIRARNAILEHEEGFNYAQVVSSCRTTGCIAGWVNLMSSPYASFAELPPLYGPEGDARNWHLYTGWGAQEKLNLTQDQTQELFFNPELVCKPVSAIADFIDDFIRRHAPEQAHLLDSLAVKTNSISQPPKLKAGTLPA